MIDKLFKIWVLADLRLEENMSAAVAMNSLQSNISWVATCA